MEVCCFFLFSPAKRCFRFVSFSYLSDNLYIVSDLILFMKVSVYNQMFGLNGRSLFSYLIGHWAVHYQKHPQRIWKRTDIGKTLKIVEKSNADVIGICEVLEGQEKFLEDGLKKLGYKYVYFGEGHKTKFSNLCVKVLIASKFECQKIEIKGFPVKNELGGGGGIVNCYSSELKTNLICVHFAIPRKKELYNKQLKFLQDYLKKLKGKIILMADFNKAYCKVKSSFPGLNLVSDQMKTCCLTPLFKLFHYRDDDHILKKGFEKKGAGTFEGRSDHKLLYADLE